MILTCPACDTKYVVKDGAIPPGGRQVRCASCKHRWHQDADPAAADAQADVAMAIASLGGPPEPVAGDAAETAAVDDVPTEAEADQMIAGEPEPAMEEGEFADYENAPEAPERSAPEATAPLPPVAALVTATKSSLR